MTEKLTIGADPEMVLVSPLTGQTISAQTIFNGSTTAEFGLDGSPTTVEIRPKPADNPLELVENIYQLFNVAQKKYPEVFRLKFQASDINYSIGGHLHFGHSLLVENREGQKKIIKMLDMYLAPLVSLVEIPAHHKSRLKGSYGRMGDVRPAPWGIEYRTLPSWIATRKLAEAVTCLGYGLVEQALLGDLLKLTLPAVINYDDLISLYQNGNMSLMRLGLPYLIKDLKKIPMLQTYNKEIKYLIDSAKAGRPLFESEIKESWHLKFLDIAKMKLANLPDFITKLGEALAVPSDEMAQRSWVRAGVDYRVSTITNHVNLAIEAVIPAEILNMMDATINGFKIRGLKIDTKNEIIIATSKPLTQSYKKQITELLTSLGGQMGYKIDTVLFSGGNNCLYIPRTMRDQNNFLSEAVALVVWLYSNKEVYKSTKTEGKRKINLPFGIHNAITPLINSLKDKKRQDALVESDFILDGGGIDNNKLFNYLRSTIWPQIRETRAHSDNRTRIPAYLKNLVQMAEGKATNDNNATCQLCLGSATNYIGINFDYLCDNHLCHVINRLVFS